jgi:UDP-N-acetylmuramoyl-L-alanyl-D-glutamate--2,6-diaminopimelate ligase
MKTLSELVQDLNTLSAQWGDNPNIHKVVDDSRRVVDGALFVAVRGGSADGHDFIQPAVEAGAAAVIGQIADPGLPVPYVQVADSRLALAKVASAYFDHPAHKLIMIGVTGTDGKTTTTNLIFESLRAAGLSVGMITTVNAVIGDHVLETGLHVTTPEAILVQEYLHQMTEAGMTHCVLEATSHGLAQRRVLPGEFDLAVVTNITHEHLDYHGSYEAYRAAKGLLFTGLTEGPHKEGVEPGGVLNLDDERSYDYLSSITDGRQITYSARSPADFQAREIHASVEGLKFQVVHQGERVEIGSPLIGEYNVSNCLAAYCAVVGGLGLAPAAAVEGVAALKMIPGRMERIDLGQDFIAMVDFAHTPNALKRALETARKLTEGKVIAVFGSAGLRDRQKRWLMAQVSVELADMTVLTAEDPRTESLEKILEEMADGARSKGGVEGESFIRVPDRGRAISQALALAEEGDLVMACGKGHEQSMCFGITEYPWDDRIAMRAALADYLGIDGPLMPFLPTRQT